MVRLWATGALLLVGCLELPPPLAHRAVPDEGEGGAGGEAAEPKGGSGGGDGGAIPRPVCGAAGPTPCARLEHIHVGGTFTCGELDDGTVRCFGFNDSHQLGDPALEPGVFGSGVVSGIESPRSLALGHRHACALGRDDAVRCWGRNMLGQLGTGDREFGVVPRLVLEGASKIATFNHASCAFRDDGAHCWGVLLNGQGWKGDDLGAYSTVPLPFPGLDELSAFAIGSMFGCAIVGDGVSCWGSGQVGQLGDGTGENHAAPAEVTELPGPIFHLAAGGEHACALSGSPPEVRCWGLLPELGELSLAPTLLAEQPAGEIVSLGAGWRHSCALLADGRVTCWGYNAYGALGHGGGASETPVIVAGLTDAVELAVGYQHNCALRSGGELVCWGRNDFQQLGAGSDEPYELKPIVVAWP